jgi:hypothetical protein
LNWVFKGALTLSFRLEKRVLVGLPEAAARELMFSKHLSERCVPDMDYAMVSQLF